MLSFTAITFCPLYWPVQRKLWTNQNLETYEKNVSDSTKKVLRYDSKDLGNTGPAFLSPDSSIADASE